MNTQVMWGLSKEIKKLEKEIAESPPESEERLSLEKMLNEARNLLGQLIKQFGKAMPNDLGDIDG